MCYNLCRIKKGDPAAGSGERWFIMVHISDGNIKLCGIPSFSFPPVVTCAKCASSTCAKKCYARRMALRRANVANAWTENLKEWNERPEAVRAAITARSFTSSVFRYFVGGDIPDADFLLMMVSIAETVKSCKFLAFTKCYKLVNDFLNDGGKLPENLQIIFSGWGASLRPDNPNGLPESDIIPPVRNPRRGR